MDALFGRNVCTREEEDKCRAEIADEGEGEEYKLWACSKCEKKKGGAAIHPYTRHLLELRRLLKAGYPFGKNDLSLPEWRDLGLLNELIDARTRVF